MDPCLVFVIASSIGYHHYLGPESLVSLDTEVIDELQQRMQAFREAPPLMGNDLEPWLQQQTHGWLHGQKSMVWK